MYFFFWDYYCGPCTFPIILSVYYSSALSRYPFSAISPSFTLFYFAFGLSSGFFGFFFWRANTTVPGTTLSWTPVSNLKLKSVPFFLQADSSFIFCCSLGHYSDEEQLWANGSRVILFVLGIYSYSAGTCKPWQHDKIHYTSIFFQKL